MTPQEVLARHLSDNDTGQEDCIDCSLPWPCDAVQMARQLQETTRALKVLSDTDYFAKVGEWDGWKVATRMRDYARTALLLDEQP